MPAILSPNQRRLLSGLTASGAEFLVIGGRAMQAWGLSRHTFDLDVWVNCKGFTPDQVWAVLRDFVGRNADTHLERLRSPGARLCIPNPENAEIDILTSVGDLSFGAAFANRLIKNLGPVQFPVPSIPDLIATKEMGIVSLESRIGANDWTESDINKARYAIESDQKDIEALRRME